MSTSKANSTPSWLLPSILSTGIAYVLYNIAKKQDKSEYKIKDELILPHTTDNYKGIRMNDSSKLPLDTSEFQTRLKYSINKWRSDGYRGCWIKLTKPLFHHLNICISLGFNVHHGNPEYIMLETWLSILDGDEQSLIPSYAYSYCGAHAFIINNKNELVVIKEHYRHKKWKIPGGAVDVNEHAFVAAQREAKEETGLDCDFLGVLAVRHLLNFRFGNTCDISFICLFKPKDLNQKLEPEHQNEVADIKWMSVDQFIQSEKHIFLGKEKENLEVLKRAANWVNKYWDDFDSKEAKMNNPCMQKFKQTHPFRKDAIIDSYHN